MLIVRHLGTPNSSSLLASFDATLCAIQYYPDQWSELKKGTSGSAAIFVLKISAFGNIRGVRASHIDQGCNHWGAIAVSPPVF